MKFHFSLHCAWVQGHNRTTACLGGLHQGDVDWKSCLASYQLVGVWAERAHQQRLRGVASRIQPQRETADAVLPADGSTVRQGSADWGHSATGVRGESSKAPEENLQGTTGEGLPPVGPLQGGRQDCYAVPEDTFTFIWPRRALICRALSTLFLLYITLFDFDELYSASTIYSARRWAITSNV